ncbi:MAG TPA: YdcF family protein [Victivallales bacterium]|nr:YdcF family protein [Victivallales bacterium]
MMDGIIILLGSPNDDKGNLSSIALERCNHALKISGENKTFKILPTGGYGEHFNKTDKPHAYYTSQYLIENGISEDMILEHAESGNTVEDAEFSRPIVEKYRPYKITVVTSDFHYGRADFLFNKEFPDIDVKISVCETVLPHDKLEKIRKHEKNALRKLKECK